MTPVAFLLQRLYQAVMDEALDEEVQTEAKLGAAKQQGAAEESKEEGVVDPADAVVQPHAVVVKILCAPVANPAVLAAWPHIHLQKQCLAVVVGCGCENSCHLHTSAKAGGCALWARPTRPDNKHASHAYAITHTVMFHPV